MSVTRHLSVIITPFSGSSVWTFPRLSYKNSAFVSLLKSFQDLLLQRYGVFLFSPPVWTKAFEDWSTATLHGCQKKRGRFKCLRLSMNCFYSAVWLSELLESREIHWCKSIFSILYSCLWMLYEWQKENVKFSKTLFIVPLLCF